MKNVKKVCRTEIRGRFLVYRDASMKRIHVPRETLEALVKDRLTINQIAQRLSLSFATTRKRLKEYGLKTDPVLALTAKHKARLSELAKKRLRENPESFHSLSKSRNRSEPCERFKQWLGTKGIVFAEEYQPLRHRDRFFSIDIAFPDKLIGIEINGNQHYSPDGQLAPYYQERHDLIEAEGWKLYELHYSVCYHLDEVETMIPTILSSDVKVTFDYGAYRPKAPKPPKASELDPNWRHRLRGPVFPWPSKEDLARLIWEKSMRTLANEIGASDSGLLKHLHRLGITPPPAGYWRRRECGYSHEESMVSQKRVTNGLRRITNEQLARAQEAMNAGASLRKAARLIGFTHGALARAIAKHP